MERHMRRNFGPASVLTLSVMLSGCVSHGPVPPVSVGVAAPPECSMVDGDPRRDEAKCLQFMKSVADRAVAEKPK
jgi:hypothetical protein